MAEGKLAERVSWLDFLPLETHSGILEGRSHVDMSERLQAMLDALPHGARVYIPGQVTIENGLRCSRSITLYGDAGRENFDNSWDFTEGGSQLIFRGRDGDALTFSAPDGEYRNLNVVLRDFIVRGGRMRDDGREIAGARGDGIVLSGGMSHSSNLRVDIDNVHVAQAAGSGIVLRKTVFGGAIRNVFLHRNAHAGLLTDIRGGIGIGEMWFARLRAFQNGDRGVVPRERAGFAWSAGSFLASQMSCTDNAGAGAILAGGPFQIDMLQVESNGSGEEDGRARRQIVLGDGEMGSVSASILALSSTPAPGCPGAHIEIMPRVNNVTLAGALSGELGQNGRHLVRAVESETLDIHALRGVRRIVDHSRSYDTTVNCRLFARAEEDMRDRTGDGTFVAWLPEHVPLVPEVGHYDRAKGVFTAAVNALYAVDLLIPLTGLSHTHSECRLEARADSYPRSVAVGNVGRLRQGSEGAYALRFQGDFPLRQGERLFFTFSVAGGPRSVGWSGQQGFLSIRAA